VGEDSAGSTSQAAALDAVTGTDITAEDEDGEDLGDALSWLQTASEAADSASEPDCCFTIDYIKQYHRFKIKSNQILKICIMPPTIMDQSASQDNRGLKF